MLAEHEAVRSVHSVEELRVENYGNSGPSQLTTAMNHNNFERTALSSPQFVRQFSDRRSLPTVKRTHRLPQHGVDHAAEYDRKDRHLGILPHPQEPEDRKAIRRATIRSSPILNR